MPYIIILIFFIISLLVLLEDKLDKKQVFIISGVFVVALILLAGLREVGIDYDSVNYEISYKHYQNSEGIDFSFVLISSILNLISNDVHLLFIIYAFFGVSMKFLAIKKMSKSLLVPLMVYVCYYYEMHECMQIRSGILAGFYLLSIPFIAEKQKKKALILLLIGSFFHISGLILIPILFLNNKDFTSRTKWFWCLVIPFSYLVHFAGISVLMTLNIPYIGQKLEIYQRMNDLGLTDFGINVFSPFLLMNIMMFYYLMYFSNTIKVENKFLPLMLKIYALGISSYMFLSFLPVLSYRVSILYNTITILLFSNVAYTIKPRWASVLILILFCFLYMNYGMKCFEGFVLLWEV